MSPTEHAGPLAVWTRSREDNRRRRLIIGIDPGTTRFIVASAQYTSRGSVPDIRLVREWAACYQTFSRSGQLYSYYPPSALLYQKSQGLLKPLPKTGHGMTVALDAGNVDLDLYFPMWKLMFHHNMNDPSMVKFQRRTQLKLDKLGKTKKDLARDFVGYLYDKLLVEGEDNLEILRSTWGEPLCNFDIEIVAAVPPGRSVIDHSMVFDSFVQGPIKSHQVFLVSEPEALLCSWTARELTSHNWEEGKTYTIADAGGGICVRAQSLVRYRLDRVDPPGFVQEFGSQSIVCGAETISEAFLNLANTKLPKEYPQRELVLVQMKGRFDDGYKLTFGESLEDSDVDDFYGMGPGNYYYDTKTQIEFTFNEIEKCFAGCVAKLTGGIESQLQYGPTDWKKIKKTYGSRCNIIRVDDDKRHVANGAVLTRLNSRFDTFVTGRAAPLSHGVTTRIEVDDEVRSWPEYARLRRSTDAANGKEYYDVLQWLVKRGDEVPPEHELASESTFKSARTRGIDINDMKRSSTTFEDVLWSIDWHPGEDEFTPLDENGELLDHRGDPVDIGFEEETKLEWSPQDLGLSISKLKSVRKAKNVRAHQRLRYSIQMRCENTCTYYWIKAWQPNFTVGGKHSVFRSKPVRSKPLLFGRNLSEGLLRSFELGTGIAQGPDKESTPSRSSNSRKRAASPEHSDAGALRPDGACWNCVVGARICDKGKPECAVCTNLGIGNLCQFTCPRSLIDFRRDVGLAKKAHAENVSRKRSRGIPASARAPAINASSSRVQSQRSPSRSSTMTSRNDGNSSYTTFDNLQRDMRPSRRLKEAQLERSNVMRW